MRAKGIYLLYRVLQTLASPAVFLYFALRAVRNPQYRRSLAQRVGLLPRYFVQTVPGCIWLHAVSVGEIIASIELVRRLRTELPHVPIYISAGTTAGRAMAAEKLSGLAAGVFYAPVDYVFAVRRTLRALQPSVVIFMETEIWPNLFRETRRTGAALVMVNGRISDRTAKRYAGFKWFFGTVLAQANRILAQSAADRDRFIAAGAPPRLIEDAGNLKYDFEPRETPPDSPVRRFLQHHAGKRVWIAASTSADDRIAEEDLVLEAFAQLRGWVLILAPRKPERFEDVAAKISAHGLAFVRRTQMADSDATILLLDTIGELAGLFALADVVFMGGTIANRGGHNILEPAFFGKPVITGPHLENFREIAADFREHKAVITIEPTQDVVKTLARAVLSAADDREIGQRARSQASARRGATVHAVEVIRQLHSASIPWEHPNLAARLFLTPFTWIWRKGTKMRTQKAIREERHLEAPVISVGNITTGGTGKTPFVAWLARRLKNEGYHPGILSRGYGRRSHHDLLCIAPGGTAPVNQTGDESQIFLRDGSAALGIADDRYLVGLTLRARLGVDVFVLDDGFSHRRLRRDLDILLIDGLAPFSNGELMPLGRLREPLEALARAGAFVITRSERSRIAPSIERKLRDYNSSAPIFHARTIAERWMEFPSGLEFHSADLTGERSIAFCGLGNPVSFWQTLEGLGISPAETVEYGDHHAYSAAEFHRLAHLAKEQRATVLLTTEKDAVNLCEGAVSLMDGVKLLWLKIDVAIDEEAALMELVASRCGAGQRRTR